MLLADAAEFFESYLWESESSRAARSALAEHGLHEEVIRAFEVGYSPIGPDELMNHLHGLDYSTEELIAAGLATRSVRGNPHAYFRSRVMFPVKDGRAGFWASPASVPTSGHPGRYGSPHPTTSSTVARGPSSGLTEPQR
jgi:hypothetical protein